MYFQKPRVLGHDDCVEHALQYCPIRLLSSAHAAKEIFGLIELKKGGQGVCSKVLDGQSPRQREKGRCRLFVN